MDLIDELLRVTEAFEAEPIPYALCGGLAVAVHGAPRATTDLDLLVRADAIDDALRVARDVGFTFVASPMRFDDGMSIRRVTRVEGVNAVTLDLILDEPNLVDVLSQRQRLRLGGHGLWVVSRDGLIRMKLSSDRPQDRADVARLTDMDR